MKKRDLHFKEWMLIGIALLSIISAAFIYPLMPEQVVSHWNSQGVPDGFMGKFSGTFIMPAMIMFMVALLIILPRADPMRHNIEHFKGYFLSFSLVLCMFIYALQIYTASWNLGYRINIVYVIIPLLSILFYAMGVMISKAKQNMTIGIRTPWTLKSETVWDATHKRTAVLIKIAAITTLTGLIFPQYAFAIFLIPLISVLVYSFVYSYFLYAKEMKNKREDK